MAHDDTDHIDTDMNVGNSSDAMWSIHSIGRDFREEMRTGDENINGRGKNVATSFLFRLYDEISHSLENVVIRVGSGTDHRCTLEIPPELSCRRRHNGSLSDYRDRDDCVKLCYPCIDIFQLSRITDPLDLISVTTSFQLNVAPIDFFYLVFPAEKRSGMSYEKSDESTSFGFVSRADTQLILDNFSKVCDSSQEKMLRYHPQKKSKVA